MEARKKPYINPITRKNGMEWAREMKNETMTSWMTVDDFEEVHQYKRSISTRGPSVQENQHQIQYLS